MSGIGSIATMVESQSLNAVIAGFSFASAIAWMDVVRWIIGKIITTNKNSGNYYLLTALLTTILAVIVFIVVKFVAKNIVVKQPDTVYAVTH